jgi:hypothetical protein
MRRSKNEREDVVLLVVPEFYQNIQLLYDILKDRFHSSHVLSNISFNIMHKYDLTVACSRLRRIWNIFKTSSLNEA